MAGAAIEAQGMGYQGIISLFCGWHPARNQIVDPAVLGPRPTPDLDDCIDSAPDVLAGAAALDVMLDVPIGGGTGIAPFRACGRHLYRRRGAGPTEHPRPSGCRAGGSLKCI